MLADLRWIAALSPLPAQAAVCLLLGLGTHRDWSDCKAGSLRYHLIAVLRRTIMLPWLALLVCLVPQSAFAESIAGKWNLIWDTEGGIRHTVWVISQDGEAVSVMTDGQKLEGAFKDGRLELSGEFYAAEAGYGSELKIEGTLDNGQLKGKGSWAEYGMTFTGKRAE